MQARGLLGRCCRVQQVQKGAAGKRKSVAGAEAEKHEQDAGITSRESRRAIMSLPLWSTTPLFGCPDGRVSMGTVRGYKGDISTHSSLPHCELQKQLATHTHTHTHNCLEL